MTERPKEMDLAVRNPSIFGNKRRNPSATTTRLRRTEKALGWAMG
jgi:hypothetical protein